MAAAGGDSDHAPSRRVIRNPTVAVGAGVTGSETGMNATLTLVLCLAGAPDRCEVRDHTVDAQACFYGGANVVRALTPEGWEVKSARCLPAHLGNLRRAAEPPAGPSSEHAAPERPRFG